MTNSVSVRRSMPPVGYLQVPGDKSISHRAAMLSAIAEGESRISSFSPSLDCMRTLKALSVLGVRISKEEDRVTVIGSGKAGFVQPVAPLDVGNSGTTLRMLAGLVSADPVEVILTGDSTLRGRPMGRLIEPLSRMGATVLASGETGTPPITVKGSSLNGITYRMPVDSAQVKSSILFAGVRASGETSVIERVRTRDHTERILSLSGIGVHVEDRMITVTPGLPSPFEIAVPGDPSSAAFFIAAALLRPGAKVAIDGVCLNETRTGFLRLFRRMGASLDTELSRPPGWEETGRITAEGSELTAISVGPDDVAGAIDEITLVALLATQAYGRTEIRGASELRVKESDRISLTVSCLRAMGAEIEEIADGMIINGPTPLQGSHLSCGSDHRIAMMLAVAGTIASGETVIHGWEWTRISYPGFADDLRSLGAEVNEWTN